MKQNLIDTLKFAIASPLLILDNCQLLDVLEVEDDNDGAGARVSSNGLAGVWVLLYSLFLLLALVLCLDTYGSWP